MYISISLYFFFFPPSLFAHMYIAQAALLLYVQNCTLIFFPRLPHPYLAPRKHRCSYTYKTVLGIFFTRDHRTQAQCRSTRLHRSTHAFTAAAHSPVSTCGQVQRMERFFFPLPCLPPRARGKTRGRRFARLKCGQIPRIGKV